MKLFSLIVFGYLCYFIGQLYGDTINRNIRYGYCKTKRFLQGRYHPKNIKTN